MPKRTNSFQKVIHSIYSQLEPEGAVITESAYLLEIDVPNPIKREVDVLIEKELGGTKLRFAVECRGRARRDSVEWIDGLIGKYIDLHVNKIIAVSESGFTGNAEIKAKRHKIELISLEQALEKDWSTEFQKLSIAEIKGHLRHYQTSFKIEPRLRDELSQKDTIYRRTEEGNNISVKDSISKYYPLALASLDKYLNDNYPVIYKIQADSGKPITLQTQESIKDMFLVDTDGGEHDLKAITYYWKLNLKHIKSNVKHELFRENALITTGIVKMKGNRNKIRVVQIKDKGISKPFTERLKGRTNQD